MGLLAMGAGAGKGLDDLLARMMAEDKFKQASNAQNAQITETNRSHVAEEGLKSRQLDDSEGWRQLQQQSLNDSRKATADNQESTRLDSVLKMRATGDEVPQVDYDYERAHHIPESIYKSSTPYPEDFQGPVNETGPQRGSTIRLWDAKDPTKAGATKGKQLKTVTYQGKPVEANYDPEGGTLTYQGQDITDKAGHYEKPPGPDRVLIQTGGGYETRDQARRDLNSGKDVPLADTSATRTMGEGAKMLRPHVESLQNQAEALDRDGLFGPIMSRVRDIAAKAGTLDEFDAAVNGDPELQKDRRVGRFATSLGLLATGAGRVHGGARGGGSPQMYAHFKAMLSDASTLQMFQGRLDAVDDYMVGYAKGPHGDGAAAATPDAGAGGADAGLLDRLNKRRGAK